MQARQSLVSRFSRLIVADYVSTYPNKVHKLFSTFAKVIGLLYILALLLVAPKAFLEPWAVACIAIAWLMRAVGWNGVVKRKTIAVVLVMYITFNDSIFTTIRNNADH